MTQKLLVLYTLSFLFPFLGAAQDIEYYKAVADSAHNQLTKLQALDSIISKSYQNDEHTFISSSIAYIDLAKEVDSIEWAAKKAIKLNYTLASLKNQPEKALSIIDGILAHKYKIQDSYLRGALYLKRGGANFRLNLNEAVKDYEKAITHFTDKDSLFIADAYLFSGQAYSNLSKFVPAGENYRKAYQYFEALKDYEYMFYAQQGIIIMFSKNGFYDRAKEERDILIEKALALDIRNIVALEYYNQSLDYKKKGDIKLQLQSLLDAEKHLNLTNKNKKNHAIIYASFVEYYSDNTDVAKAKKYMDSLETLKEYIDGSLIMEANYNFAKAKYSFVKEDFKNARMYAEKSLEKSQNLGYEEAIISSHHLLSKIYMRLGNYKKGAENQNAYTIIKDSLYNNSTANSLAYYQTLYETEKKEKELVEQSTNIQLLEKDNEIFKKLIITVSFALILIFGMILLFRNQRHLKSNKTLQEKYSQELLVSQEKERMRISKDLHDGIGQQLLLIKNKLITSGDENTIEEVRTISRDLHPFQLQEMGITKAIEYTLRQIDENTTLFISSEIDNIDDIFSPEQEVNIYRIVQESFNNIIKHAKAKASKISITQNPTAVLVSIKDNGRGFDFTEGYQNNKSLGLKTLLERTKFLNGQMKVQSKKNNGTLLEFQFPIA